MTTTGPAPRPTVPPRGLEPARYTRDGHMVYVLPLPGHRPSRALSPNGSHGAWQATYKARRTLKAATVTRVRQAKIPPTEHVLVTLHYVPKDKRVRDADNLTPILKPCLDALTGRKGGAGIIPDDTPEHVTWRPPIIHAPDVHGPRLWLEVTVRPREVEEP